MKDWRSSNFGQILPPTPELSAIERLKKLMYNVVNNLALSFLMESSLFLQVTSTTIKSGLSSKVSLIGSCTADLAVLDRRKKSS